MTWFELGQRRLERRMDLIGAPYMVLQQAFLMPSGTFMDLAVLFQEKAEAEAWVPPRVVGYRFRYARNTRGQFRYIRAFAEIKEEVPHA